jgi:hypothetical protein
VCGREREGVGNSKERKKSAIKINFSGRKLFENTLILQKVYVLIKLANL